jgi:predicted GIY-YIG superfamily endonuclease
MYIYWIHLPEQTDVTIDGYVGIAHDFKQRMFSHKSCAKTGKEQTLYKAIRKYGWENLIKEIILIADENYCLQIEKKLRSKERIGWNIAIGGGEISGAHLKGKPQSLQHIANRTKALIGRVSGMKGKKMPKESIEKTMKFVRGVAKTKEHKQKNAKAHKQKIEINNIIYDSWLDASNKLQIPMGSIDYILKSKPKQGKYAWVNSCNLVM